MLAGLSLSKCFNFSERTSLSPRTERRLIFYKDGDAVVYRVLIGQWAVLLHRLISDLQHNLLPTRLGVQLGLTEWRILNIARSRKFDRGKPKSDCD